MAKQNMRGVHTYASDAVSLTTTQKSILESTEAGPMAAIEMSLPTCLDRRIYCAVRVHRKPGILSRLLPVVGRHIGNHFVAATVVLVVAIYSRADQRTS